MILRLLLLAIFTIQGLGFSNFRICDEYSSKSTFHKAPKAYYCISELTFEESEEDDSESESDFDFLSISQFHSFYSYQYLHLSQTFLCSNLGFQFTHSVPRFIRFLCIKIPSRI